MNLFKYTFELFGHAFAIGANLDVTTLSNLVLQVALYLILRLKGEKTAYLILIWFFLECEAAYRFQWEYCCSGNIGDIIELLTAILTVKILNKVIRNEKIIRIRRFIVVLYKGILPRGFHNVYRSS